MDTYIPKKRKINNFKIPFGCVIPSALMAVLCQVIFCISAISGTDSAAPAPIPSLDVNAIYTQAMQTALFSLPPATRTLTPLPTETPTPVETPTLEPTFTPAIVSQKAPCVPNTQPQTAKVVEVVDGDTIKVMLEDGLIYSVRYIGMDTPEDTTQTEYYGAQASAKNMELVYGKTVTMYRDVSEVDRYGRLLRYVFVDDVFVNYELVAQGFAEAKEYPPDTACAAYYSNAQLIASASRTGVWALEDPLVVVPTSASGNTGEAVCGCSSNSYNCNDFSSGSAAQACFEYCRSIGAGDVHRLDSDSDGSVCESMQ